MTPTRVAFGPQLVTRRPEKLDGAADAFAGLLSAGVQAQSKIAVMAVTRLRGRGRQVYGFMAVREIVIERMVTRRSRGRYLLIP